MEISKFLSNYLPYINDIKDSIMNRDIPDLSNKELQFHKRVINKNKEKTEAF